MVARVILHGAILAIANLFSIWLGFIAHALAPEENQLIVQLPVAMIVSVVFFLAWVKLVTQRGPEQIRIRGFRDEAWIYGLALVWGVVIFVPLHYVTQGYLTAFSNLLALWAFQLAINFIAIAVIATAARVKIAPVDRK